MCTKNLKNTSGGVYTQLDFEFVEKLKFECYRTTAVFRKHSQWKMIWWTCFCHQSINDGFYIYSRTNVVLKIRFTKFFAVTQNYDCFINESKIRQKTISIPSLVSKGISYCREGCRVPLTARTPIQFQQHPNMQHPLTCNDQLTIQWFFAFFLSLPED